MLIQALYTRDYERDERHAQVRTRALTSIRDCSQVLGLNRQGLDPSTLRDFNYAPQLRNFRPLLCDVDVAADNCCCWAVFALCPQKTFFAISSCPTKKVEPACTYVRI